jgi:hypothetical protein
MDERARRYQPTVMRASDADRDAVLAELSEHFQAGRLTLEEFDQRSSQALSARTFGDLAELTKDLPPVRQLSGRPVAPRSGPAGPRLPVAAVAAAVALVGLILTVLLSGGGIHHSAALHVWWIVLAAPLVLWRAGRSRR